MTMKSELTLVTLVGQSITIATYIHGDIHLLAMYESGGGLSLFHQLSLGITTLIRQSIRIVECLVIFLLVLHYKGLSRYPQICDVVSFEDNTIIGISKQHFKYIHNTQTTYTSPLEK